VAKQRDKVFPERDALVAFIRAHPGKLGTREIAREFGLKNADRAELKRLLRELADEGAIVKTGKKIHEPAALPPTVMADITGRDSDGELIAIPAEWDEVENGASIFPEGRKQARRQESATARCCGSRYRTSAKASIAVASSRSSITPKPACSESSAPSPAAADGSFRSTRSKSAGS
jgi:ribonuclease R